VFRSEATRKHDAIVGGTAQERTPWRAVQRAAWAAVGPAHHDTVTEIESLLRYAERL
jgi:hypothetical protein